MKRILQVCVGNQGAPAATLRYEQKGNRERTAFSYEVSWLDAEDRFGFEPNLPLLAGPQFPGRAAGASIFPGAIADTEPDGWGRRVILRDHAKRRQRLRRDGHETAATPLNAVDFLLAVDDDSRVGALRFRDEQGIFQRAPEAARRTAPPLIELRRLAAASRAVETEDETAEDLAYLRGRGTSLGGLRPKCTVVDEDGHLAIGKFPSVTDDRAVTRGEVLALRLATAAGIRAAEARVVESDGVPVALIRRFDRVAQGARVPYISAATLLGVAGAESGEHAYTEIVEALRRHGAAVQADCEELWRRMAYSILINNVDDHLRNHGFLHVQRGLWRLAPAFDLNPFPDRARELKTWISPEAGPEASLEALRSVAAYFGIPGRRAHEIIGEVERAVSGWREMGRTLGMTTRDLENFAPAFAHPERSAAGRPAQRKPAPRT